MNIFDERNQLYSKYSKIYVFLVFAACESSCNLYSAEKLT